MDDFRGKDGSSKTFVCPSDRILLLRAKLHTGWSATKSVSLMPEEQEAIISVIKRNEALEIAERQRVGKLVERVEKIKQRAIDYGPKNCRLCGQSFGLSGFFTMATKMICEDCKKPVCSKCSIELPSNSPVKKEICLCKVCSEIREMWKKSGAWFYKGLPNYELPQRDKQTTRPFQQQQTPTRVVRTTKLGMEIEDSSSEDEYQDASNSKNVVETEINSSVARSSRNIFNLRLSNGNSNSLSKISVDDLQLNKRSPKSPLFSRQTSSSDSQKSAHSIKYSSTEFDTHSKNRRSSISSSRSISECSPGNESSIAVNQIFREPIVLGWLELSLNYNESNNTLDSTIVRARDLPAMDALGLADPFCKLNIITIENTLRSSKWLKTKVVHKTKNPEFNETLTFIGITFEDIQNCSLYVVLLDEDKYGHDFLGSTKLTLSPLLNATAPIRMSVPLGAEDKFSIEAVSQGWPNGQMLVSLCYNTQKRGLSVIVKRCINLISMDNNGFSDPFVKLQLKPDSHRKKYKTSVKWRNLNPVFNEEFFFETRPNDLDKQSLIMTVWDKDLGKSNDFLGSLILGSNSKGRRLKQWKDCIRLPDQYHECWHCLSNDIPNHHH